MRFDSVEPSFDFKILEKSITFFDFSVDKEGANEYNNQCRR